MHINEEIIKLTENGYKKEVADGIFALEKMLDGEPELARELDGVVLRYAKEGTVDIGGALSEIAEISKKYNKNEYSLDLLLIINGLPYMHESFRAAGISDEVFYETMDDIRCKVNECVECKGVVGTFVADWYDRFFKTACFAFGRFQFEEMTYDRPDFRMSCGRVLTKGDKCINMHIPSRGIPLTDEIRLDSYRRAYRYFAPLFPDGLVIFCCHSWLLYEKHLEFLPEKSNIRKFIRDFELVENGELDEFGDGWRVFGRYAGLPASELPRDTSLRAAYADWLSSGHRSGHGFGVFAFDGEKIVK